MITIIVIMNTICYLCINSKLCLVVYIKPFYFWSNRRHSVVQSKTFGGPIEDIGWSNRRHWVVQSKTLGGPIEETVATIGPLCNFFYSFFSTFVNDFLVINSLLLKIKYKLYVSILLTSILFVFASTFKFIVRGPNPGNSPLLA